MKIAKLVIEYIDPMLLHEDPGNANVHPEDQIEAIAASIRQFGMTKPVLIDADGVLIAGHGTRLGAIRAGLKEIPCVRHTQMSERDVRAYRLADNQLAKRSTYDFDLLADEVAALVDMNFDIDVLGFSEDAIEALLKGASDEIPAEEPPVKKRVKPAKQKPNVQARIVRDIVCPACQHKFEG